MSSLTNPVWLQHKPLTPVRKKRTYVQLPAFDYVVDWKGYSELVTQFNFSASSNFYLKNRPAKPSGVNYLLCIKYRVGDTVYRYKLWAGVGEVGLDEVKLYSSNLIKKNFVLEVWSTGVAASQDTAINLITSVATIPTDISDLSDTELVAGEEFNDYNPIAQAAISLPATVLHAFGYYQWEPAGIVDAGGVASSWTNSGSLPAGTLNPLGPNPAIVAGPNGYNAVRAANMQATIGAGINNCLFLVCKPINWIVSKKLFELFVNAGVQKDYLYFGPTQVPEITGITVDNGSALTTTDASTEAVIDGWNILRFRISSVTKNAYLAVNGSPELSTGAAAGVLGSVDRFLLDGSGSSLLDVAEAILYNGSGGTGTEDQSAVAQVESYLMQKYALGVTQPLVFDPRTAWLDNS